MSKKIGVILEDDFTVLSGSLPGAGAVVVPLGQLARIGDGAFHSLLQEWHGERYHTNTIRSRQSAVAIIAHDAERYG
jgi:hypothetical protein